MTSEETTGNVVAFVLFGLIPLSAGVWQVPALFAVFYAVACISDKMGEGKREAEIKEMFELHEKIRKDDER